MNTANLKLLTIAGITATSLICLPAIAKEGNGHGNGHGKGKAAYAYVSKDKHEQVQLKRHQSEKYKFKNGYSSNAQRNHYVYQHTNPYTAF